MSQLIADGGELMSLTDEQREFLLLYGALMEQERQLVRDAMQLLSAKHRRR
jgi:hypothetical protein